MCVYMYMYVYIYIGVYMTNGCDVHTAAMRSGKVMEWHYINICVYVHVYIYICMSIDRCL